MPSTSILSNPEHAHCNTRWSAKVWLSNTLQLIPRKCVKKLEGHQNTGVRGKIKLLLSHEDYVIYLYV